MCVFIKLHITTQSGPVTRNYPPKGGSMILILMCVCVCMCVCVFIKLHITAQFGHVILVLLCYSH